MLRQGAFSSPTRALPPAISLLPLLAPRGSLRATGPPGGLNRLAVRASTCARRSRRAARSLVSRGNSTRANAPASRAKVTLEHLSFAAHTFHVDPRARAHRHRCPHRPYHGRSGTPHDSLRAAHATFAVDE